MIGLLWHMLLFPALLCYYLSVGTTLCLVLYGISELLLKGAEWVAKLIRRRRIRRELARRVLVHVEQAFQFPDRPGADKAEFEARRRAA